MLISPLGAPVVSPGRTVIVAKSDGDVTTIAAGIAAASALTPAPSATDPASVLVYPGVYTEVPFTIPAWVSLVGVGNRIHTKIIASTTTSPLVTGNANACIWGFRIEGANGAGGEGIGYSSGATGTFVLSDIEVRDCTVCVLVRGSGRELDVSNVRVGRDSGETLVTGVKVTAGGKVKGIALSIECLDPTPALEGILVDGASSDVHILSYDVTHFGEGIHVTDGGTFHGIGGEVADCTNAFRCRNGAGFVNLTGIAVEDSTDWDVLIEDAAVEFILSSGFIDGTKVSVLAGATFLSSQFSTIPRDQAHQIVGELHVGTPALPSESVFGEGDSHVNGMLVFQNKNLEVGSWNDITTEMVSAEGSPSILLPGVNPANCAFIGGDTPFPGIKIKVLTALVSGAGSLIWEYWNGAIWVAFTHMSSNSIAPYEQYADSYLERVAFEQIRFGAFSGWTTKSLDGETKYWVRLREISAITTVPVIEQIKLHTNRTKINADGRIEHFGAAEQTRQIPQVHWSSTDDLSGSSPANVALDLISGVTLIPVDNLFADNQVDGVGIAIQIPAGIDTSRPVLLKVGWRPSNGNAGDVEQEVNYGILNLGDDVDGTAASTTISEVTSINAQQDVLIETEFSIPITTALPGATLVFSYFRDGTGPNADDTYNGNVENIYLLAFGDFWK